VSLLRRLLIVSWILGTIQICLNEQTLGHRNPAANNGPAERNVMARDEPVSHYAIVVVPESLAARGCVQ
jgi:hypothetical protein